MKKNNHVADSRSDGISVLQVRLTLRTMNFGCTFFAGRGRQGEVKERDLGRANSYSPTTTNKRQKTTSGNGGIAAYSTMDCLFCASAWHEENKIHPQNETEKTEAKTPAVLTSCGCTRSCGRPRSSRCSGTHCSSTRLRRTGNISTPCSGESACCLRGTTNTEGGVVRRTKQSVRIHYLKNRQPPSYNFQRMVIPQ